MWMLIVWPCWCTQRRARRVFLPQFSSERQFIAAIHDDRLSLAPGYIQAVGPLSGFRISPLVTAPRDIHASTPLWCQMSLPATARSAKNSLGSQHRREPLPGTLPASTRYTLPDAALHKPHYKIL